MWSRKYFHNKLEKIKPDPKFYNNFVNVLIDKKDFDWDILVLHGNQSHCLDIWSIGKEVDPIPIGSNWIKEFLQKDLEDLNPRIIFGGYETFQEEKSHHLTNIPNYDIYELWDRFLKSLQTAGVGTEKPLFIICFSMGGVIAKLVLNHDDKISNNCKGITFFATPHLGSDVRDDTAEQLGTMLSGAHSFMDYHSITNDEFVIHFLDNLRVSKISKFLVEDCRKENLKEINAKFSSLNLPMLCITEGLKIYYSTTDHEYYVVSIVLKIINL